MDGEARKSAEKVAEEYGGMISMKSAEGIAEGRIPRRKTGVGEIAAGKVSDGEIVDIEGEVYRVFNKIKFEKDGKAQYRRTIVIGDRSANIRAILWGAKAELPDYLPVERGDRIGMDRMRVRRFEDSYELSGIGESMIRRIEPCKQCITDFSYISEDAREIDVAGRLVSVGQPKYFNGLGGKKGSVADCSITDGKTILRLVLWDSSSEIASEMHPGGYVKAEYVSAKKTDAGIELSASDLSRILIKRR